MTHTVKHRGPDGYGFAFFNTDTCCSEVIHNESRLPSTGRHNVGLGNRRLAILDLSTRGNQPMQTEDCSLTITYNGEIYNYIEVRNDLIAHGHVFRTTSDTEIVIKAYQEWGLDCVARFNGMWSFALWDARRKRLVCSRDRFGEKPFYYYLGSNYFLFGSEIKQLLEHPGVPRVANDAIVFRFLEQYVHDNSSETFFKDIWQLPAGHTLTIDLADGKLLREIHRYWDLPLRPLEYTSAERMYEEFAERFRRSVAIRLRSDVPVGSCLSGGLDSSSIVCVAAQLLPERALQTFFSRFREAGLDESEYVQTVVSQTAAISHVVSPTAEEFWSSLEDVIWHHDEPIGDASVFAQWCVMKAARASGVPVLLDGQGGDEALCGYRKFYYFYLWELLRNTQLQFIPEAIAWLMRGNKFHSRWRTGWRYLPSSLTSPISSSARVCRSSFINTNQQNPIKLGAATSLSSRQKSDLTSLSVPILLHYEDRNSMAHSVETRLPFLDHELVDFMVNCPSNLKLRSGWTKWILRQGMKNTIPEKVRMRRTKIGFETPQRIWMQQDVDGVIKNIIGSGRLQMDRILDTSKVSEAFNDFLHKRAGALSDNTLFRVLSLELWARQHKVS